MPESPEIPEPGERTLDEALVARIDDLDARLRVTEIATGDERTAKELRKALEAIAKHDPKLGERLTDRVDVVADRLNTVATTISTTAASLAGKDGEMVGLRRELERVAAKIEALTADSRSTGRALEIDELRRAVAALSAQRIEHASDKRVAQISGKVDFLAERIDTLAATVATTAAGLAGRDGDVSALRRRFDVEVSQVARDLAELRKTRGEDKLASQIGRLSDAVAMTAQDLARRRQETAELRTLIDDGQARLDSAVVELRRALGAAVTKVEAIESASGAQALVPLEREVAEAGARIETLSDQLEALGAAVETTVATGKEKEREIAALGRRFEQASTSVDELVTDLRDAIGTMPGTAVGSSTLESELGELEQRVTDLTERLTSVARDRGAAGAELARTTAFWSSELSSIEARFDELGGRLDSLEDGRGAAVAPASALEGGGRLRLEIRALELRMEHTETAARENREAVLTQLERLASRIDWRLQRLEAHPLSSDDEALQIEAQVVPIRGTEP